MILELRSGVTTEATVNRTVTKNILGMALDGESARAEIDRYLQLRMRRAR